jgi:hypothetical protein
MTKDHARKNRAKRDQAKTGARYTSANAGAAHEHPLPDLTALQSLPYASADRPFALDLAARTIAACRAGCQPCQKSLIPRLLDGDRVTIAALASVFGLLPSPGALASDATRAWQPLAQRAQATGDVTAALQFLDTRPGEDLAIILDDALDQWALGGLTPDQIHIINLADFRPADEPAGEAVGFALRPGMLDTPRGEFPFLAFTPETPAAERADFAELTEWPAWDLKSFPQPRDDWRLRAEIATQSLAEVARIDWEGMDDIRLWQGSDAVRLPDDWWYLLDRVQRVILFGPSEGDVTAERQAADEGRLFAVIARVSFW